MGYPHDFGNLHIKRTIWCFPEMEVPISSWMLLNGFSPKIKIDGLGVQVFRNLHLYPFAWET